MISSSQNTAVFFQRGRVTFDLPFDLTSNRSLLLGASFGELSGSSSLWSLLEISLLKISSPTEDFYSCPQ